MLEREWKILDDEELEQLKQQIATESIFAIARAPSAWKELPNIPSFPWDPTIIRTTAKMRVQST
jgi:hypothetical protein